MGQLPFLVSFYFKISENVSYLFPKSLKVLVCVVCVYKNVMDNIMPHWTSTVVLVLLSTSYQFS
jgi:hypothetical protein